MLLLHSIPCTVHPSTHPAWSWGCPLLLVVKPHKRGGVAAAGSVPCRFLLMVLVQEQLFLTISREGGWALSTGLWSHLLQEFLPSGNNPSHFSALPVTSSGSFASSAALMPLPKAGPALPRQVGGPWPSWCSWLAQAPWIILTRSRSSLKPVLHCPITPRGCFEGDFRPVQQGPGESSCPAAVV